MGALRFAASGAGDQDSAPTVRGTERLSTDALDKEIRTLTGIGTWEWDIEKQSMAWSPETKRIFEVDPDDAVAPSDMPKLRSILASGLVERTLRDALRSGTPWKLVHPALTARGREIWIGSTGHVERAGDRSACSDWCRT